jgi:hypothetical protein
MSSGDSTKSMQPLAIAFFGMSRCLAVLSFCAIVMPHTSFMSHNASAPSLSHPETMMAISLPSQEFFSERKKTVITSGHLCDLDNGLRWNFPFRIYKS